MLPSGINEKVLDLFGNPIVYKQAWVYKSQTQLASFTLFVLVPISPIRDLMST